MRQHFLTLVPLILLTAAALLAGCGKDDYADDDEGALVGCTGETVTIGSEAYCVYQGDVVVEEGFRCPDAAPHLVEHGGVGICSPSEELADERIGEIAEAYDRQVEPENNGVGPDNDVVADSPEACMEAYPGPLQPDDVLYEDHVSSPPNNSTPDQTIEVTAADVEQECMDAGGAGCDLGDWITREAAECIAAVSGLADGLEPWTTVIFYRADHQAVVWIVSNVERDDGGGSMGGSAAFINAATGEFLGFGGWDVQP